MEESGHATLKTQFERDGYVPRIPVLSADEAGVVRAAFDVLEAGVGRDRAQIGLLDCHYQEAFVHRLATHPAILDAVAALIGDDLMLLASHFFCKYPAANQPEPPFVAWHQDVTYWGLEPPFAVTAWYAVDDSDAENGCMRVIPGSHLALRRHGAATEPGNLLSVNQEASLSPEEVAGAVDLPLSAGEISLHHGLLIHGSNPNRSDRRRCGLTLRFIPPSVRQSELNSHQRRWNPLLVRGSDVYGHYC